MHLGLHLQALGNQSQGKINKFAGNFETGYHNFGRFVPTLTLNLIIALTKKMEEGLLPKTVFTGHKVSAVAWLRGVVSWVRWTRAEQ